MERSAIWVSAVVALVGSTASAQSLAYFKYVDGVRTTTTPIAITGNTIDVGTIGAETPPLPVTLHIFDPATFGATTAPTQSVTETLTITGTYTGGSLIVGFTDGDVPPYLDAEPATEFDRGVVNLGPANQPVLSFSSDALRDATTLVAWIGNPNATDPADRGNVTGSISVGRIYVLDVPRDITGTLTATANDKVANPGFGSRGITLDGSAARVMSVECCLPNTEGRAITIARSGAIVMPGSLGVR